MFICTFCGLIYEPTINKSFITVSVALKTSFLNKVINFFSFPPFPSFSQSSSEGSEEKMQTGVIVVEHSAT